MVRSEYHTRDGLHVSTEIFDTDGFICEMLTWRRRTSTDQPPSQHWWFVKGTPVRVVAERWGKIEGEPAFQGPGTYVKQGTAFVKIE